MDSVRFYKRRGLMAPTIGITTYHTTADWRGWSEEGALLPWKYVNAIRTAGEFGEVRGYAGDPLAAPPLPPGGLKPR